MNVTDDWKNKEFYYFVGIDVRFATLKIKLTQAGIKLKKKTDRERERDSALTQTSLVFSRVKCEPVSSFTKKTDKRTCRPFKAESFKFFSQNWVIELTLK